ncbi:MAG: spore coat U domain-containing protein [Pseudomonadota bacterium]
MKKLLVVLALVLSSQSAWAACSISAQPTSFGNYNPLSITPLDAAGQVAVNCSFLVSLLTTYTVKLSTGSSGTYSPRQMQSGANTLSYNLYLDALRLLTWGNGSAGTSFATNTQLIGIGGFSQSYPVYGRIPAQQNIAPATYSDTITVTLDY